MSGDMGWKDAIFAALKLADAPLSPQQIAQQIGFHGFRRLTGEKPTKTVAGNLWYLIRENPPTVRKSGHGLYELISDEDADIEPKIEDDEGETPTVMHYGIGWERSRIQWKRTPFILGEEAMGADTVNIADFFGVYLLLDNRETVYVGRVTDRSLGNRLYEHTRGRLSGRWNRFSWFAINEEGESTDGIISILESIMIEALEPRLNRRAGENLGPELIQVEDPEIKKKKERDFLRDLADKID